MANPYFTPSGIPQTSSPATSSAVRAEFAQIEAAFNKIGTTGPGKSFVRINSFGTLWENGGTYESQSVVPTFSFSTPGDLSVSYNTREAFYVRMDRVVWFTFSLNFLPTFTTASGQVVLTFPSLPSPSTHWFPAAAYVNNYPLTPTGYVIGLIQLNTVTLYAVSANMSALQTFTTSHVISGTTHQFVGTAVYKCPA